MPSPHAARRAGSGLGRSSRLAPAPAWSRASGGRALSAAALAVLAPADPMARIALVRRGVPAAVVPRVGAALDLPRATLCAVLGLARATLDRKVRDRRRLSAAASERVLGVVDLVVQVERMWRESGDHAAARGFDPARWLGAWLDAPNPALGGERPSAWLDTADGRGLVRGLLGAMQAGTYW